MARVLVGWAHTHVPDGRVLVVWTYSTGPEENGVRAAVGDGTDWTAWKPLWSAKDTIGWQANVDVNSKGQVALASTDQSRNQIEVQVFETLDEVKPPKGASTRASTDEH